MSPTRFVHAAWRASALHRAGLTLRGGLAQDIGGLDIQKQEVREAVELPLTHFELYKQIGIDPPRGVSYALGRAEIAARDADVPRALCPGADVRATRNRKDHAS